MTVAIESFYRAKILTPIQSTDAASTGTPLVINVSEVPVKTSGYLTISPNTDNEEIVYYSAIDGTNLTISIAKRAISPTTSALTVDGTDWNVTAQKKSHAVLDAIRWDINNLHINQISEMVPLAWGVMTGPLSFSGATNSGIRANNLTTTQRDALTPAEGMIVMNTTEGVLQKYETGAWSDFSSGSVSNASTTVSGKVEVGTQTEVDTPTDTGGTGATVVVIPSTFQTGITNKLASQAEAEAGSSSTKLMTPQRTSQFLTGQLASQAEAEAGSNDVKYMSPLKVDQALDANRPLASNAEAQEGTSNTKLVNAFQLQSYTGWNVISGLTYTIATSNADSSTSNDAFTKLKEFSITVPKESIIRVNFQIQSQGNPCDAAVYLDWAQTGLTIANPAPGPTNYNRDVTLTTGTHLVSVYWRSSSWASDTITARNYTATYDLEANSPEISATVIL